MKKQPLVSLVRFEQQFERETGFDMMDRDGRTVPEHIRHNIEWFRDWAKETADRLEALAKRVPVVKQ